jgi:uncharacterized protein YcaQ
MKPVRLTAASARALMLAAQDLLHRPVRRATKRDVLACIRRMGALQIDTIHVVARSPYLVLFSRLGAYAPEWLDELLAERALFEYWSHEACFLPFEDYPLYRHRMLRPETLGWKYRAEWVAENRATMARVLERMSAEGALRSADFAREDGRGSGWWGWKPEKRALEYHFSAGVVMVARRERFQRVYDLRTRVYPEWSDEDLPDAEAVKRTLAAKAVRALGITTARWAGDYFRTRREETAAQVAALGRDGELIAVEVAGWPERAWVHRDHEDALDRAAADRLRASHVAFLSPFDPLVWDRERARTVFGFDYALECYTPARKRRFGYFTLPVLRRGALVGRMDAKAHRRTGRFEVKVLHLEPGVRMSASLMRDLARALSELAAWHEAPHVDVRRTVPAEVTRPLRAALRDAARA